MQSARLPAEMAAQFVAGQDDPEILRWLREGLQAHLRDGRRLPLERCLRLPSNARGTVRMQRNLWLSKAATYIECSSPWDGAGKLVEEYEKFLTRGTWRAWCDLPAPPADASELRAALWHVAKAREGRSLSQKTIDRLVGHVFSGFVQSRRAP